MTEDIFHIKGFSGEKKLSGTISVNGAKNAATKAFAASFLFDDTVHLSNIPNIADIEQMKNILIDMGVSVENDASGKYTINTQSCNKTEIDHELGKKMRSSAVLIGPVLARFGEISFSHPGGCVIGARPIDLFLSAFEKMGANISCSGDTYTLSGKLVGADIFFDNVSVGATETLMMAATLAKGKTVLRNAAMEPEIVDVGKFLISCGAKIEGLGTPTIVIEGGELLSSDEKIYKVLPDRVEAGSFLILGALSAKELRIDNCDPGHIQSLLSLLYRAGVPVEVGPDFIVVNGKDKYSSVNVKTHEYPGFATDLQAPMTVFLTQAKGESLVFETIFDGRLHYVEDLIRMGADITIFDPHRVLIRGPRELKGRELVGPDLRAGLAFLIAAIIADGESTLSNIHFIDRGYENIEGRLQNIGVAIERIRA